MEIIGRDKIVQNGSKNRLQIDNRKKIDGKAWAQTWWGMTLIGISISVTAGGILYVLNWN